MKVTFIIVVREETLKRNVFHTFAYEYVFFIFIIKNQDEDLLRKWTFYKNLDATFTHI